MISSRKQLHHTFKKQTVDVSTQILSISLQKFLELLPDAVVVSDMKGETLYVNPVAEKFLDVTFSEIRGKNILDILPFAPQKFLALDILSKLNKGGSVIEELSFVTKKGAEFHGIFTCTAATDEEGVPVGVIGILKDNTERKHHEDMLYFLNKAGEELASTLDYNQTITKIEELIVPRLADWFSIELVNDQGDLELISIKHKDPSMIEFALELRELYPADKSGNTGTYNVLRTGKAELYEEIPDEIIKKTSKDEKHYQILKKIGFNSVMIIPLKLHGKTIGTINFISTKESGKRFTENDLEIAEDFARKVAYAVLNARLYASVEKELEERKKTEELLQLAQEYGNMATFSWNLDSEYSSNRNISMLYGTREDATMEDFQKIIHPDDIEMLKATINEAIETGDFYAEFRIIPDSQNIKWILGKAKVLYENGKPEKLVGVNIDITRLKELEQKKDEFISIASHELKTPLTSVKAYLQLMERMMVGDEEKKFGGFLTKTQGYVDKLSHLINDLLNVSKIQAGKLEFIMEEFDFDQLVKDTVESIQNTVHHNLVILGSSNATVRGDKVRIEQVFFNLISNAVKYSPKGDRVEISLSSDNEFVHVSVRDFGIGISNDNLVKIFDRFYRAEHSANQFTGLGIGLYICAEIIKRHEGVIWAESAEGGGSVFHFKLPLLHHL